MTATPGSLALTQTQFNWALKIIAIIKGHGYQADWGPRIADIALGTVLTESGLRMYANGNNPASMNIPHDAVGYDHGSVGLFQQQVGGARNSTANWGTTAQCMDVTYSTNKFVTELLKKNWLHMTNWDAAQAVQGSFDPTGGNYKRNDARAVQIRIALWAQAGSSTPTPKPPAPKPPAPKPPASSTYTVVSGDTLSHIASVHGMTLAALEALNPHAGHPAGNFNNILPGDHLVLKKGASAPAPKPAPAPVKSYRVIAGDTLGSIASRYRTTVPQLEAWNRAKYPNIGTGSDDHIEAGWTIRVG